MRLGDFGVLESFWVLEGDLDEAAPGDLFLSGLPILPFFVLLPLEGVFVLFFTVLLGFPDVSREVGRDFLVSEALGVKNVSRLAWERERFREVGVGVGRGSDGVVEGPRLNFWMYSS